VSLPLVIGLGRVDRGDDAVGPAVARIVADVCEPWVDVEVSEQPADLMEVWSGRDTVVLVDAIRSGAPPGTVHVLPLGGEHGRGDVGGSWDEGGTHALGVRSVVGLADALGLLPATLMLVGVEASSFDHGSPMSPAVAAAVDPAADEVIAQVAGRLPGLGVRHRRFGG
jgi:hydrogenase maturation protease